LRRSGRGGGHSPPPGFPVSDNRERAEHFSSILVDETAAVNGSLL
jgi:hypothetical protein